MKHRTFAALLAVVALAFAGCGASSTPFGSTVQAISTEGPLVVSGRLVDYAAKPAAGILILVSAWPTAPATSDLAARDTLHQVGWLRSGDDGSFEVHLAADETLTGYATEGNNVVNFELTFFSGKEYPNKGVGAFGFSLPLAADGFISAGSLGDITVFP